MRMRRWWSFLWMWWKWSLTFDGEDGHCCSCEYDDDDELMVINLVNEMVLIMLTLTIVLLWWSLSWSSTKREQSKSQCSLSCPPCLNTCQVVPLFWLLVKWSPLSNCLSSGPPVWLLVMWSPCQRAHHLVSLVRALVKRSLYGDVYCNDLFVNGMSVLTGVDHAKQDYSEIVVVIFNGHWQDSKDQLRTRCWYT